MNTELLRLLEEDATLTPDQLAVILELSPAEVREQIAQMEKDGVILGYKTIVDWEKTDCESVTAMIDVKLTPQRDRGFDRVAEKIYNYPEVKSVYLMSGVYDLSVVVEGKSMKDISFFVSQRLAPIEAVISTATHFVLHKYKDTGVLYETPEQDERGTLS